MDSVWERLPDAGVPEWQRQPFERNLLICDSLLPPVWCQEWLATALKVFSGPGYQRRTRAEVDAIAAQNAEREAAARTWQALVARVKTRIIATRDVIDLNARVETGDPEAMELMAWMYLKGVGVPIDYARSYALYARAFLSGRATARENLDKIWPYLKAQEKEALRQEFGRATP